VPVPELGVFVHCVLTHPPQTVRRRVLWVLGTCFRGWMHGRLLLTSFDSRTEMGDVSQCQDTVVFFERPF